MTQQNTRRGNTQKTVKNNSVNIPELVSGSSTQAVTQQRAASAPWNNCHKVGNLSGYHPTYEEEALNKDSFRAPLRSGFTLIELLVVVLIIGILAAVALPQYQKAVRKSKAGQVLSLLRSLTSAQEVYYLANGTYSENFEQLDLQIPGTEITCTSEWLSSCYKFGNWDVGMQKGKNDGIPYSITAYLEELDVYLTAYLEHKKDNVIRKNSTSIVCEVASNNLEGKAFCISIGGQFLQNYGNSSYYNL